MPLWFQRKGAAARGEGDDLLLRFTPGQPEVRLWRRGRVQAPRRPSQVSEASSKPAPCLLPLMSSVGSHVKCPKPVGAPLSPALRSPLGCYAGAPGAKALLLAPSAALLLSVSQSPWLFLGTLNRCSGLLISYLEDFSACQHVSCLHCTWTGSGISAFGQWCQELALDSDPTSAGSLRWGPFSQVVTETMAERESRWKVKVKMPTSTWSGRTGEAPEQVRAGLECGVLVRSRQDDPSQPKGCQQGGKDCAWKIWGWGRGARSAGRGLDPQAGRWTSAGQEGGIHPERQGTNQTPACGLSRSPAPRRSGCLSTQGRWSTFYCRGKTHAQQRRPSAPINK